jgi:sugar/nucleoside kinase (ribokinase family)
MKRRKIALLSVGELLIDVISADFADTIADAELFKRIPGGSPANMCMNMSRLGNEAILVASVGNDDMGRFLKDYVKPYKVDRGTVKMIKDAPTTLILVTRSKTVSNFEAYRTADRMISLDQMPIANFKNISFFHTTCFALSMLPAKKTIIRASEKAHKAGCVLSIDLNYAQKIWPNRIEAQQIIANYLSKGAIVKISEVDWERLYESKLTNPEKALDKLLGLGASEVCVTLGGDGCWVANQEERHFIPSRPVNVVDTTGAGDAFWSGYITARLDDKSILEAAKAGRAMAEIKLSVFGPLPLKVDRAGIYEVS